MNPLEEFVKRRIERRVEEFINQLEQGMITAGELAVATQRTSAEGKDYTDRTGNLRSSIGYVVKSRGETIAENIASRISASADAGEQAAKQGLEAFGADIGENEIGIAIVAGMHYGRYVSHRGFDVIDTAQLVAEREVTAQIKNITEGSE